MKSNELNYEQLCKIFSKFPDWVAENRLDYVVNNEIEWMEINRAEWMDKNRLDLTNGFPNFFIVRDVPENILSLIRS